MIPFSPPNLEEEEIQEVIDTLRSEWITTGPKTRQFEQQFAEAVGAPAALALNSCTAGLHLALVGHGIGPGDVVATTPMTFAATANVVEHVGAESILVDVEPDTLNIDPERLRNALHDRVKAISVVHYAGHPVDLDAITAIANERGIPVIEDAAHALPASYRGEPIGARGNLTAYSFYATKNITTAEGGMLTGSAEMIEQLRSWSLHGLSKDAAKRYERGGSWKYEVLAPGFKYNMTDVQASLGTWQLRKAERFHEVRRSITDRYNAAFGALPELQTPTERDGVQSALHLYVLRLQPDRLRIDRDEFIEQLRERNISTSVHFIPIHLHPYYRDRYGYQPTDFPVAYAEYQRMLSLPLFSRMTDDQVERVIEAVRDVVEQNRR